MKYLLVLILSLTVLSAQPKPDLQKIVKTAVESHVAKYNIGGYVVGCRATVEAITPSQGWEGHYNATGTVEITNRAGSIVSKQTRTFSATIVTENGRLVSVDVSV